MKESDRGIEEREHNIPAAAIARPAAFPYFFPCHILDQNYC